MDGTVPVFPLEGGANYQMHQGMGYLLLDKCDMGKNYFECDSWWDEKVTNNVYASKGEILKIRIEMGPKLYIGHGIPINLKSTLYVCFSIQFVRYSWHEVLSEKYDFLKI